MTAENASTGLREIVTEAIRGCFDRFDEGDGPPEHVIADDVMLALTEPDDPIRRSEDAAVALFVIGRYRELLAEVERLRKQNAYLREALRPFAHAHWRDVHPGRPAKDGGFFTPADVYFAQRVFRGDLDDREETT